ncbi:WD repeat-containing protein 47 [Orchesella cincta]|uniref:WD repeat-containing protein 47 n=1 Tax=Orchesella cincta TaxID=48709 RepID=A0A1D2MX29_ORCCI|nr:WD repeat-containing protein 47 [Orchesella cincta]
MIMNFKKILQILNDLETVVESKEEYSSLCLLLTSPSRLAEHPEYKDWKSSTARIACFHHLRPLVQKFIPPPSAPPKSTQTASNDRLVQLLIKGLLYETCVDFCQSKAMTNDKLGGGARSSGSGSSLTNQMDCSLRFSNLLNDNQLSESDLSLLSWLRSIPGQTFSCPFQRRSLRVDIEPLPKPQKTLMNVSIMDSASDLLSRSMASTSFHLSSTEAQGPDLKTMTTSVDRLFGGMMMADSGPPPNVVQKLQQNRSGGGPGALNTNDDDDYVPSYQNSHQTRAFATGGGVPAETRQQSTGHQPPPPPYTSDTPPRTSQDYGVTTNSSSRASSSSPNTTPKGNMEKRNSNGSGLPDCNSRAKFIAVTSLEDVQAVRCAEFHPAGRVYAIGSNSKTLRVCAYPDLNELTENHVSYQPTVLFKRTKHHKGSIYCLGWSPDGNLLATGSNDKTVKLLRFDDITSNELQGSQEVELSMHDGTVRDVCFIEETSNKGTLLVSGGAGDCKIYVTDCATATPFQALSGHTGAILSLYNWGGQIFCSGSQDKTIRFWDLRTRGCVDVVTPLTSNASTKSAVTSVCVDPSGRLMVCGHEDAAIVLYDIRGQRQVQSMKTHSADVRSVRFSPAAYYLLSGGYDNRMVLTDLQGDLSNALPSVVVATHQDKVISGRWHPSEFTFLSTSADKTAILWGLPPEP